MKTGHHSSLTEEQQKKLLAIENLPDDQIDLSDRPEKLDWSKARRGMFRPMKQQLTVRFDADVIVWFRQHSENGRGYQTRMNKALREYILAHESEAAATGHTDWDNTEFSALSMTQALRGMENDPVVYSLEDLRERWQ